MRCLILASMLVFAYSNAVLGMTITSSSAAPASGDIMLSFDTTEMAANNFFTIARGGGASGVGGGESAYGQTFRLDVPVTLDAITIKTRVTQDVAGLPLLLWFGEGFSGATDSGLSSLMVESTAPLPDVMNQPGDVHYVTMDIEDQMLLAGKTYAFLPRFGSGGGVTHPEMEVGFMGAYAYPDGAAFNLNYSTILNNEMVFFLHGAMSGDFNGDRALDSKDIDLLSSVVRDETNDPIYDLNADDLVNEADRTIWVKDLKRTFFGDANLNGEFNSTDLVLVFRLAEYEDEVALNSTWESGDWNGDGDFTSSDLVTALQDGGYEQGQRVNAVPEPSSGVLLLTCLLVLVRRRK